MRVFFFIMQCVGLTMALVGGAAMDEDSKVIPVCMMAVGGLLLFLFLRLEKAFYFGEEFSMYYRLEQAGLIIDTDEWKEVQEEKLLQMMEEGGETDAGSEADIGQAL